jgi:DNA-binding PadR family transcriptional regulator
MEYSKADLARIKMDENKYKVSLGWDVDLLSMLEQGFMEIVGERNGENIYSITDLGKRYVDQKIGRMR